MGFVGTSSPWYSRSPAELLSITASILLILGVFVVLPAFHWYAAGIQQQVWERSGCHMTRWEIFVGAEPLDRSLVNHGQVFSISAGTTLNVSRSGSTNNVER